MNFLVGKVVEKSGLRIAAAYIGCCRWHEPICRSRTKKMYLLKTLNVDQRY